MGSKYFVLLLYWISLLKWIGPRSRMHKLSAPWAEKHGFEIYALVETAWSTGSLLSFLTRRPFIADYSQRSVLETVCRCLNWAASFSILQLFSFISHVGFQVDLFCLLVVFIFCGLFYLTVRIKFADLCLTFQ